MNYYVYINGATHKLVQGFTISEEYNETLDSASIIISDSPQLDIDPYDDVFIYSEYCGYYDVAKGKLVPNYENKFEFRGYPIASDELYTTLEKPFFYKHFLIYKFVEKIIILGEKEEDTRYEYTIELFSETKGLETIQAPNTSITQPLTSKVSTVTYINRFLELYNKRIKKADTKYPGNWSYYDKYSIGNVNDNNYFAIEEIKPISVNNNDFEFAGTDQIIGILNGAGTFSNLVEAPQGQVSYFSDLKMFDGYKYYKVKDTSKSFFIQGKYDNIQIIYKRYVMPSLLANVSDIFEQSYTPDFTLNNPSLRQILEKLFITKDCIPVVYDDEIYAIDITLRRGKFNLARGQINYITGSKDSTNYCTDLRRTYNNALTQENSSRFTEFLGFRNSDSALLTLSNLRLETRFPIYKINKMYMCYFKKIAYYEGKTKVDKVFLCKQDITPLVKLNSERNILSEDIEDFKSTPKTIEEMAKYKLATVGYDIGSNYIDGWGTQYSYPTQNFFWQTEVKSYVENLFKYMDNQYPYGIYNYDYLIKRISTGGVIPQDYAFGFYSIVGDIIMIPEENLYDNNFITSTIEKLLNSTLGEENLVLHLKHLFFEIDYQGFYNGTVIHSKGLGKDNLTITDNQAASLTLLELDGLAQKEKLDRYGNKGIQISARYKDVNDVQPLGSVYEHNKDQDIVIYHKEYSINDNVVDCSYSGTKDYVLKDYFTTVFARYRPFNLMSYGESITRSENKKIYFLISKTKSIKDRALGVNFSGFDTNFIKSFFSFYNDTKIEAENRINENEKINYGFFRKGSKIYTTDINVFVCGNSLCLNICMFDNITSGTYISKIKNTYLSYDTSKYSIGATQKWINLVDDMTTGEIKNLDFCFGHIQTGKEYGYIDEDKVYNESSFDISNKYDEIFKLPLVESNPTIKNQIYFNKNIYKDNKEKIDMTLQIEPIMDDDIYVSPWFAKLSDLFSVYSKFNNLIEYSDSRKDVITNDYVYFTLQTGPVPILCFIINIESEGWLNNYPPQYEKPLRYDGVQLNNVSLLLNETSQAMGYAGYTSFNITINNINSVSEDSVKLNCEMKYEINRGADSGSYHNVELNLTDSSSTYLGTKFYQQTGLDKNKYKLYAAMLEDDDVTHLTYKGIEWRCWIGDGKIFTEDNSFIQQQNAIVYGTEKVIINKSQNLYWIYTPAKYEFRSYMVSDEFDNLDNFTKIDYSKNEIKLNWLADGKLEITHPELEYGSHILCYYKPENGKYNFVFGFKPDQNSNNSQKTKTMTEINISLLSFKDLTVYDEKTNLPIGTVSTIS